MMGDINFLKNYKGTIILNSGLMWGAWGILLTLLINHILSK
jgi:hypothetical protein